METDDVLGMPIRRSTMIDNAARVHNDLAHHTAALQHVHEQQQAATTANVPTRRESKNLIVFSSLILT